MDFKKKMIILGGTLVLCVVGIIAYRLFTGGGTETPTACNQNPPQRVQLAWWGDLPEAAVQPIIAAYTGSRQYVSITYTQLDPETSRQKLIEAWARNAGPDIFSVRSEELKNFASAGLISPMPAKTTSYTYTLKKTLGIKEDLEICKVEKPAPSIDTLRNTFVTGAFNDLFKTNQILGFPLAFDSLAMFYNQQLLDEAGILTPPKTWSEFVSVIPKLTLVDDKGKLVRAGAALGRSLNVARNAEILTAIFKQYNIDLSDKAGTTVTFAGAKDINSVLTLATSFGNPTKATFTWDETFPDAMDALAQGKTAIAFGTATDYADLKTQTTGADIRVTTFPQSILNGTVFIADYWLQTVAPKAADPNVAWDFLRFAADQAQAKNLIQQIQGTPAIRALVETASQVAEGETPGPAQTFARQAATAFTWFPGLNPAKGREALDALVEDIATQKSTSAEALDRASKLFQLALSSI
ncbi:extracellular solute-binding protein [Candidatus Parcubacteria bacterium]|nr:MAG: extracellular solute-binding protein [Candidatus Parcubacteria bacterium]